MSSIEQSCGWANRKLSSALSAISLSSSPVSRIVGTEKSSAWSGAIKESAKAALGAEIRGKPGVTGTCLETTSVNLGPDGVPDDSCSL